MQWQSRFFFLCILRAISLKGSVLRAIEMYGEIFYTPIYTPIRFGIACGMLYLCIRKAAPQQSRTSSIAFGLHFLCNIKPQLVSATI